MAGKGKEKKPFSEFGNEFPENTSFFPYKKPQNLIRTVIQGNVPFPGEESTYVHRGNFKSFTVHSLIRDYLYAALHDA